MIYDDNGQKLSFYKTCIMSAKSKPKTPGKKETKRSVADLIDKSVAVIVKELDPSLEVEYNHLFIQPKFSFLIFEKIKEGKKEAAW